MLELFERICETTSPADFIGITIDSERFSHGAVWMSFRLVSDFNFNDLWQMLSGVAQSSDNFDIDDSLIVSCHIVSVPQGRGRVALTTKSVFKKSILTIDNRDNFCLPRSLVVAQVFAERGSFRQGDKQKEWEKIRKSQRKYQLERAVELVNQARVTIPHEGCGLNEIHHFQKYLVDFEIAIVVYSFKTFGRGAKPLFDGTNFVLDCGKLIKHTLRIMYYDDSKHFEPILNLIGASGCKDFCIPCNKSHSGEIFHKCSQKCLACFQKPPCDISTEKISCFLCKRNFFGENCFANHTKVKSFDSRHSVCDSVRVCFGCHKIVRSTVDKKHRCGYSFCKICKTFLPVDHLCFMQPIKSKNLFESKVIYLFYDFETMCDTKIVGTDIKIHSPNLCVVQQVCCYCFEDSDISNRCEKCGVREHVFKKEPVKEFVQFALKRRENFTKTICIAHNAQGFDSQFILKFLVERKDVRDFPSLILNGSKIILMEIENVKFLDSLNYLHMPLSALPKTFGLPQIEKDTFPHLFNTRENQNYIGTLPPVESYSIDSMKSKDRTIFLTWYNEQKEKNLVFDFQKEILKYCKIDVSILRMSCLAFRENFLKCGNVDPFVEATTIASACSRVYRKNFLKEKMIGIIPNGGYRCANKQSLKALQWLRWMEHSQNREIQHAGRCREKRLPEGFLVDGFYDSELPHIKGVVLQFHGCYWHGCPRCFRINRDFRLVNGETLQDRFERTCRISSIIRENGYELFEKWECEFDKELEENVVLKEFIESRFENFKPLNPRDAFFGGRTGNTVKMYDVRDGEKIKYVDVCSLYPYECKIGKYPIGHPKIFVGQNECRNFVGHDHDISHVDGLIFCEVLPPRNLYHPVLPVRMHNKLLFALCRTCVEDKVQSDCPHHNPAQRTFTGTWVSEELKIAVEKGYEIRKIFEIWHYQTTQYDPITREGGLFHGYIDKFFKLKTEASGLPVECNENPDLIDKFIDEFEKKEGIKLDKDEISFNPGLRAVLKLMLNSLWGKFGQRENRPKTEIVKDPQRLWELLVSSEIIVNVLLPVNDETLYVSWHYKEDALEPSPMVNVVIAAFVTAQARLKLLSYLEPLRERVLYYDTDSIIYVTKENVNQYEPPTGPFLGDLTDELSGFGQGSFISSFLSGGPKFYAYKVVNSNGEESYECKIKGIRLNYENSKKINFQSIRDLVSDVNPHIKLNFNSIRRTNDHLVINVEESKICRPVYEKRRFVGLNKSFPYGFKN